MTIIDPHLQALEAAHKKALIALGKKPTVENIKAVSAAERALADYRARTAEPSERRYANLLEALAYLQEEGYKVAKSKIYTDREAGKIAQEPDGAYTRKALDDYARNFLERLDGSDSADGLAEKKARLEIEVREETLRRQRRENEIEEGKWVLKSEAEQKHTVKLGLLMTAVDNFIHGGRLEEAVELVNGDKERAVEFKAFFKKEFRAMLGEYAKRPEFTVPQKSVAEAGELIKEVAEG